MHLSAMSILDAAIEAGVIALIGFGLYRSAAPRSRAGRVAALSGLTFFVVLVLFLDLWTYSDEQVVFLKRMLGWVGLEEAQLAAAVIAILFGCGAHWFKRIDQQWYGVAEVLFGIAAAFESSKAFTHRPPLSAWIGLGVSAYIIERGLNNRREGIIAASRKLKLETEG